MTLAKRLRAGAFVWAAFLAAASPSLAAPAKALSQADARQYAAAFDSTERGDFIDARMQSAQIQDRSLMGYLSYQELMHPSAHKASFEELSGWLGKFRDLPLADRVFALAARRKPADAGALPVPQVSSEAVTNAAPVTEQGRRARDAFYSGDPRRALELAPAAGEYWIAGLAAFRLNDLAQAETFFTQVARDAGQDSWMRAAGAYWASRTAASQGDAARAQGFLKMAAQAQHTFYGMIAARQAELQSAKVARATEADPVARLILASFSMPDPQVERLLSGDPRAHRAAALAQIGRLSETAQELRAGLTLARSEAERRAWTALAGLLGSEPGFAMRVDGADYPTPALEPRSGFTVDKALVYAIVRQESRFNPFAVSPAGAVGLMQLMPGSAARAAGDDKLRYDTRPLLDPAFNLRVGQDYLTWLMERGVGYDLLRTVAAYNGGPGTLQKTVQMLGGDPDPLLLVECLPAQETRNYVERVLAGYWTYRKIFGEDAKTLDAVASGARLIDARLDLADPRSADTQLSSQPLQVGMQ